METDAVVVEPDVVVAPDASATTPVATSYEGVQNPTSLDDQARVSEGATSSEPMDDIYAATDEVEGERRQP